MTAFRCVSCEKKDFLCEAPRSSAIWAFMPVCALRLRLDKVPVFPFFLAGEAPLAVDFVEFPEEAVDKTEINDEDDDQGVDLPSGLTDK